MILAWALIGLLVGALLGLTGAGGAIIALPLFIYLTGSTPHQATVFSLVAVLVAALLNWPFQRKQTVYGTSILLFVFSIAGSYLFLPIKAQLSSQAIIYIFSGVAISSLFSIWRKHKSTGLEPAKRFAFEINQVLKTSFAGFVLGGIISLTGLGGGVFLVPLLNGVMGYSLKTAAATSLFTILLSSVSSLYLQWAQIESQISMGHVLALLAGSVLSVFVSGLMIRKWNNQKLDQIRKVAVTFVVLASVISVFVLQLN